MDLIEETFEKVYVEGFEEQRIESILHSAELSKKHEKSNFGLGSALGMLLIQVIVCDDEAPTPVATTLDPSCF